MATADRHLLSEHHFAWSRLAAQHKPYFMVAGTCLVSGLLLLSFDFAEPEAIAVWAGIIIALGLIALIPILSIYARSIKSVSIYEEGISWAAWRREEFHAWDEVREVYRAERTLSLFARETILTLVFKRIDPVVFDSCLSGFFQMATTVEAVVTERILPVYRQSLEEGGAHFGPVILSRVGIRINDRDFAWNEVEEYAICNGGLVLTPTQYADRTGEFVPFSAIPNYLAMLRLLEELGQHPS